MLELRNVNKSFPINGGKLHAVRDVSFSVAEGEIFGIIGLSGAGKSTLLRCINVLERPDSGEIRMDGVDLTTLPSAELFEKRREIGMIFQGFHLLMQKTAMENVLLPVAFHSQGKAEAVERAESLLEIVGLAEKRNAYPAQLSGGQKQRLAIARALVTQPRLLLSDEATSALDPQTTESILRLIRRIVNDFKLSVVMITHQMEVAREVCDTVAVMDRGRIIETGSVHDLFLRPKEERTREMIHGMKEIRELPRASEGHRLYRLGFDNPTATRPLISTIVRKFDVDVNILAGNIYQMQEDQLGELFVEIWGTPQQVKDSLSYLKESGVTWEVRS